MDSFSCVIWVVFCTVLQKGFAGVLQKKHKKVEKITEAEASVRYCTNSAITCVE
ncbi:Uncharacterised protein [Yersinia frederiksenii]|nr:Uncharacterised protein [Yersinia frederiksenii]